MSLEDFISTIIFVALVIGITFLGYRVTRFEYITEEKYLIMKWYFLGLLPIKSKINLDSIIEVQEINPSQLLTALLKSKPWPIFWGKFSHRLVLIKKKGFFGTVLISPANPKTFAEVLRTMIDKHRKRETEKGTVLLKEKNDATERHK
ncbi:MAG: hypothetical protein FD156_1342 [Nitrospirae bacterium]|nr:MAG: hypothetical protein FD156_1342 [Nitrospirota bacterium]